MGSLAPETPFRNLKVSEISSILKLLKLESLDTLLKKNGTFYKSLTVDYTNCGSEFPDLPGNFPCSFLSDDFSREERSEDISMGSTPGGKISIDQYRLKDQTYFFEISGGEDEEHRMRLFYRKDRFISHYIFSNQLILFHWEGNDEKSLTEVFRVTLGKKNQVLNIGRIDFAGGGKSK